MCNRYFIDFNKSFKSDNLNVTVQYEVEDTRDVMDDTFTPVWERTGEYYIQVQEVFTFIETEAYGLATFSCKHTDLGRELAFRGDEKFLESLLYIAHRYDSFDTVVNAARVLMPQA